MSLPTNLNEPFQHHPHEQTGSGLFPTDSVTNFFCFVLSWIFHLSRRLINSRQRMILSPIFMSEFTLIDVPISSISSSLTRYFFFVVASSTITSSPLHHHQFQFWYLIFICWDSFLFDATFDCKTIQNYKRKKIIIKYTTMWMLNTPTKEKKTSKTNYREFSFLS